MKLFVKGGYLDYQIVFLVLAVSLFGVLMVYSASSYRAIMNGLPGIYYAKKQFIFGVAGFIIMLLISRINYRSLQVLARLAMVVSIFLCAIVFVIGIASHGASRWIPIGSYQFQPSEVAKIGIIMYVADRCNENPKDLMTLKGLLRIAALPLLCIVLIGMENLSTAIICFLVVAVMLFVASPNWQKLVGLGVLGVGLGALALFTKGYRSTRFKVWRHPELYEEGFQTLQSLYAIGSGGLFGRGLGQSIQKLGFLPESHNDMIFSIICEELGLFGGLMVLLVFVMLLSRFRYVSKNAPDMYGGLVVTGIMTHIAIQLLVNVGVVTNTIPNTGVTLPFISYGGTSLVMLMVEIGVVLGISRKIRFDN